MRLPRRLGERLRDRLCRDLPVRLTAVRRGVLTAPDPAGLFQQRLRLLQVGSVEALGKPAADRREDVAGFGMAALFVVEPGEARGGPKLPEPRALRPGDAQGSVIQSLAGLGMLLPQHQPALVPIELRGE